MWCPLEWIAECALAVEQAPAVSDLPSTGIPAVDAIVTVVVSLATGAGGLWAANVWRASRRSTPQDGATVEQLAERQEATAAQLDRVTKHLERVDEHLRDTRERLAKMEGREGL